MEIIGGESADRSREGDVKLGIGAGEGVRLAGRGRDGDSRTGGGRIVKSGDFLRGKGAAVDAEVVELACPAVLARTHGSDAHEFRHRAAGTGIELGELGAVVVVEPCAPGAVVIEIDEGCEVPLAVV